MQKWEQIFECKNEYMSCNAVRINAPVQQEVVFIAGRVAVWDEKNVVDRHRDQRRRGNKWRSLEEVLKDGGTLEKNVLVERFVLKRMDGSLVMTYDVKHIHLVRCIWE
ncbi:hypothetical protein AgCh_017979 [Apium graveolens]